MELFDCTILGTNIGALLKSRKMTQKELGSKVGIGQPTINKYVNGELAPSLETFYNIAQFFGVSMDSLFEKADEKTDEKVDEKDETSNNREDSPSYPDQLRETLRALATIFKYSALSTKEINVQEEVYSEIIDEDGQDTGRFRRVQVESSYGKEDPTNKYISVFYSNYSPIASPLNSWKGMYDDYFTDLESTGNRHDYNVIINNFINKLTKLHSTYDDGSMDTESYHYAIDKDLDEALKQIKEE